MKLSTIKHRPCLAMLFVFLPVGTTVAQELTEGQREEAALLDVFQAKGFSGGEAAHMRDIGILMFMNRFCGEDHTSAAYVRRIFKNENDFKVYGNRSDDYWTSADQYASLLVKYADSGRRQEICAMLPKPAK
ncbi:hypothetical protein [Agrobacterium pusense]|uniref:Rap1a immunity protein domain-containing protein n=1 Tax=Agrobacterium pusense TaxID=648995 RepID=A0AA44EGW6_9HYPH|nr:hypothetical protein [Agrobacterium pusense]MCJ2877108.1 hypothetical protein [Agrobacterium pusense]NRF10608.1 hypothetical protein [Agrobacterium pusense]NRF18486.1 hypothetical protein [Agrobacterium pusense]